MNGLPKDATTGRQILAALAIHLDGWAGDIENADPARAEAYRDVAELVASWLEQLPAQEALVTREGDEVLFRHGLPAKCPSAVLELAAAALGCDKSDLIIGRRGLTVSATLSPVLHH